MYFINFLFEFINSKYVEILDESVKQLEEDKQKLINELSENEKLRSEMAMKLECCYNKSNQCDGIIKVHEQQIEKLKKENEIAKLCLKNAENANSNDTKNGEGDNENDERIEDDENVEENQTDSINQKFVESLEKYREKCLEEIQKNEGQIQKYYQEFNTVFFESESFKNKILQLKNEIEKVDLKIAKCRKQLIDLQNRLTTLKGVKEKELNTIQYIST